MRKSPSPFTGLAHKVKVVVDPDLNILPARPTPCRVDLETKGHGPWPNSFEFVKEHPKNPMTVDECVEKLKDCVRFSAITFKQKRLMSLFS